MSEGDVVLAVVREHCRMQRWAHTPGMVINGRPGFAGEEAEDLIYAAADAIGLPSSAASPTTATSSPS